MGGVGELCAVCGKTRLTHEFIGEPMAGHCGEFRERAPLSRDSLLHEIARSLRATHPERAEELIRAAEKAMPVPHSVGAQMVLTAKQANDYTRQFGGLPPGTFISEPVSVPPAPTHTGGAVFRGKGRRRG